MVVHTIIPALGRQENLKFKASLDNMGRLCLKKQQQKHAFLEIQL
jgi:hypothetical protein